MALSSTPAGKFVYKGMLNCHQTWEYRLKCPDCKDLVHMDAEHLIIPNDATPETIEQTGVEYACDCGAIWDDRKREHAIRHGRWYCVKGADIPRPSKVGFHHRAWECLDIPLTEIAAAWLRAKTGDLNAKTAWANGYEAIDYIAEISERQENYILRLCDTRPDGLVPHGIDALTMHIDTQDKGFWYTVRAWRFGEVLSSWLVKAGYVTDLAGVERLLYGNWYDAEGTAHVITWAIIDTQGHRTTEIYLWCLKTGVIPAQGASGNPTKLVSVSSIANFPGTNRALPGVVRLHTFNTHKFKDELALRLMVEPSDPGAWRLHSGFTTEQWKLKESGAAVDQRNSLEEYARHCCAEGRDDSGLWQNPNNKANHLWDCEVMALVLANVSNFHNARRDLMEQSGAPAQMLSNGI
jgi:phage terminase large subunit GpA-like protein